MAPATISEGELMACHHESFLYGQNQEQMILQLTAPEIKREDPRAHVDLVVVLDTSGSMAGDKLENLKKAMMEVISWLNALDSLSIVTFSDEAHLKYDLTLMNKDVEIRKAREAITNIKAEGWTNIEAGLRMGVGVLQKRQATNHRGVIFLLSDGAENKGNARLVRVVDYVVETFGFGTDKDPKVLQDISCPPAAPLSPAAPPCPAACITGGGYHNATDVTKPMASVFSRPAYIQQHIVVENLVVRLQPVEPIVKVEFGAYPQGTEGGIKKITLGDLFAGEHRRGMFYFSLQTNVAEIKVQWTYKLRGSQEITKCKMIPLTRPNKAMRAATYRSLPDLPVPGDLQSRRNHVAAMLPAHVVVPRKIMTEETRLTHVACIREAMRLADGQQGLQEAQKLLADGLSFLYTVLRLPDCDVSKDTLRILCTELEELHDRMDTPEMYRQEGMSCGLACLSSHERQRPTSRADVTTVKLFTTPRMEYYLGQAVAFDERSSSA